MSVKTIEVNGGIMKATLRGVMTKPLPCPLVGLTRAVANSCLGVVLDLSEVDFINSIGISVLLDNFKYLRSKGIPCVICSARPQVLKSLRLSRTDTFIPVVKDYFVAKKVLQEMSTGGVKSRREHILMIQNKLNLRSELRTALKTAKQDMNYVICTALNIAKAWHFLETLSINMIIIDVTVPNDKVQEFIEQVRLNKKTSGIPIFIATDEKNLYNASYHTRNGADDIMHFPFNQYSTPTQIRTGLSLFNFWCTLIDIVRPFEREPEYATFIRG